MCGIVGFVPESLPDFEIFDLWMKDIEIRGRDGFGIVSIHRKTNEIFVHKNVNAWSQLDYKKRYDIYKQTFEFQPGKESIRDLVVMAISRNAPETEMMTTSNENIQPIIYHDEELYLVHNGAITSQYVEKYKQYMKTNIDSEVILQSYIHHGYNIKQALENISGGWSAILYDKNKDKLFVLSSFLPLAHGYIRGLGYIVHSDVNTIKHTVELYKHVEEIKYTRLWEDFYFNELSNFKIYEIDLDSKLVVNIPYKHRYIHPTWKQEKLNKTKVLVLHSGGIDSTTTLVVLKELGYDVSAIHISYGQKSQEAEYIASKQICEKLNVEFIHFDLSNIYSNMSKSSMLTNPDIQIQTGSKYKTKTTQAWTPGRNLMFMSIAFSYAEELILTNQYDKVYIAGGYPNISEESVYPDNSRRFVESFQYMTQTGLLTGKQIKWINVFAGLTKKEELILLKHYGYDWIFGYTLSCDNAIVEDGIPKQCWCRDKHGMELPACGSGKLSYFAAKLAGIKDTRQYYTKQCDENYEHYVPGWYKQSNVKVDYDIDNILSQLILPED